jgi:anti-anti-sigma factor
MSTTHGTHWLEREDFGPVTVVRFKVPKLLDDDTVRAVFDPIHSLLIDAGRHHLVLNLATVEYLPSLAIGKLVLLNRRVQAANGQLALCHLTPEVTKILDLTGLIELFNIYSDEQKAVQAIT